MKWVLIALYTISGEPVYEFVYLETREECYTEHKGFKSLALRAQKPIALICLEVPEEQYTDAQDFDR